MTELEKHWNETKELIEQIDSKDVAKWLLEQGYFPEQYVFPPNFKIRNFLLREEPYNKAHKKNGKNLFTPKLEPTKVLNVTYPKTKLTNRIFGIYHPKAYHDIVWHIEKNWNQIRNHLFNKQNKIFSYSFPIPVSKQNISNIGTLRTGRMIYEYLELVEKNLLIESYKYKYLLKTDIKNFYPSIYSHSIAWAIHSKKKIRNGNENNYRLVGNVLDKLIQYGNDRKTNGIPIGPAISDLIAEIILTAVDKSFSKLMKGNFISARYKDDYFFLINNDNQRDEILKALQICFKDYNLFINEEKTETDPLPEGLFRPWILEFDKVWVGLAEPKTEMITFRNFITITQEVFLIDSKYPSTGLINKFLAKLTDKKRNYTLTIDFSNVKNKKLAVLRTYSLLIHLSNKSKKTFPNVLGVIESILRSSDDKISPDIKHNLITEMKELNKQLQKSNDIHKKLWWIYFVLTNNKTRNNIDIKPLYKHDSCFLKSFEKNEQKFFNNLTEPSLFEIPVQDLDNPIAK